MSPEQLLVARARLTGVRALMFDLDGCVWFGAELAPGAAELMANLRARGIGVGFLTNTSTHDSEYLAGKLSRLGIPAQRTDVLSPIDVLGDHPLLLERPPTFVIGSAYVKSAVGEISEVTEDPEVARLVVLARDIELDYHRLSDALHVLNRGGALLALNLDARVPVEGGRFLPGNGAFAAALTTASGVEAHAAGKPAPFFFQAALDRFGFDAGSTVMVGDNLDSDIAGARSAGLRSVLVGGEHFSAATPAPVPDLELDGVADILTVLEL